MNLLKETLKHIKEKDKKVGDISFIKQGDTYFHWEDFRKKAADIEYYGGFGVQYIKDTEIVYKDGSWSNRCEIEGAEWWEHYSEGAPSQPAKYEPPSDLVHSDYYWVI